MNQCPKCNSGDIVPRVRIMDRGVYSSDAGDLTAVAYEDPDALIFKRRHESALFARLCGACGYTELYMDNPRELYEAFMKGKGARS